MTTPAERDWRVNYHVAVNRVDGGPLTTLALYADLLLKDDKKSLLSVGQTKLHLATAYGAVSHGIHELVNEVHEHPDRLEHSRNASPNDIIKLRDAIGENWGFDTSGRNLEGYLRARAEFDGITYERPKWLNTLLRHAVGQQSSTTE